MDWMLENEEFFMFVVVPALLLPVGWVVTKLLKTFEILLGTLLTSNNF